MYTDFAWSQAKLTNQKLEHEAGFKPALNGVCNPAHLLSATRAYFFNLAAVPGFEPEIRESKSRVLPLHHTAIYLVVEGGFDDYIHVVSCCATVLRTPNFSPEKFVNHQRQFYENRIDRHGRWKCSFCRSKKLPTLFR